MDSAAPHDLHHHGGDADPVQAALSDAQRDGRRVVDDVLLARELVADDRSVLL